jgi:iron complex outermembrane receptor protein
MRNISLAILLFPFMLHANEVSIEDDFLASLDEVSDIASKSKLNIDDMPAFVTILQGKKLELLGVENIYEALSLVPGVELSMEASGAKQVVFRGVKEKGKVKLLIDGVTINNTYRGSMYYYLDFPIEMIERIEVIRGPGSVLYGSNAISGVISIITKNAKESTPNRLFLGAATSPRYFGGAQTSYDLNEDSNLKIDGYYQASDIHIDAGPDKAGLQGESDESLKDYSIGVHLKINNLTLLARFRQSQNSVAFGLGNYFVPDNDDGFKNSTFFAQINYENSINSDIDYKLSLGAGRYRQEVYTRFFPHPAKGDVIYDGDYAEGNYYGEILLNSTSLENNRVTLGARYEYAIADKTSLRTFFKPTGDPFIPVENIIEPDSNRNIFSLYIDDSLSISDDVDLIAGLRWDNYSDFGNAFSPRLGVIWRTNSSLNLKMLYSRSFRAPSWIELYATIPGISKGNADLDAETADTIELGAVYRSSSANTLRFNIYATQIDNLILREDAIYQQHGKNKYYGAELESIMVINNQNDLKIALSYVNAIDDKNDALPDIANFLANINFLHEFTSGITSGSVVKYVSSRKRQNADDRDTLDGYILADQTFSYQYDTLTISASLKNIFDEQYEYPAPSGTYINDYPRLGRSALVSAKWEF